MSNIPLLPYWVYRVTPVPALRTTWRGWRLKMWAWDVNPAECEECGSKSHLLRVDTPIGRGSAFGLRGRRR